MDKNLEERRLPVNRKVILFRSFLFPRGFSVKFGFGSRFQVSMPETDFRRDLRWNTDTSGEILRDAGF
jgi:hypothetical protein